MGVYGIMYGISLKPPWPPCIYTYIYVERNKIVLYFNCFRKKLEEEKENSESGFESIFTRVEAQSRGAKNQNQSLGAKNENQQPKEKFHIDEQFIRKVLEFETSSPLIRNNFIIFNSG